VATHDFILGKGGLPVYRRRIFMIRRDVQKGGGVQGGRRKKKRKELLGFEAISSQSGPRQRRSNGNTADPSGVSKVLLLD